MWLFCWRMPQLMPMVTSWGPPEWASCASHPKLLHMSHGEPSNHVSSWGPPELSHPEHYPKISLTVPAPGCGKPIPQPSNDHSPRPATLGIHPSIEFCRHPITTKPLPSSQVWHGLQKSMLVRLRYGVQLQQWLTHIHSSIFTWMCMMLVSKPLISPTTTLVI